MRKNINIKNEALALKFEAAMNRFGYSTSVHFIEDMITFFENNPVNPKQNFNGVLNNLENKIDKFHCIVRPAVGATS